MRPSRASIGAFLLAALYLAGCAPISVSVDYDPQVDFSGYRSWGWLPEPTATGNPRVDDPMLHQRIRWAIEAQLESRGFVAAADPQMRVGYHLSTERKLYVRTVNSPYAYRYTDGRTTEIRGEATTYVNEYERGMLVIDIVDTVHDALVWRGVGERQLRNQPTSEQVERSVRQVVAEILKRFAMCWPTCECWTYHAMKWHSCGSSTLQRED